MVTIAGSGFTTASAVKFGTIAATGVTFISPMQIKATAPAGATGPVDVTVTTTGGVSATSSGDVFDGYSITPDFSTFNALTSTGAGFTFSGAEVGATYNYSIASNNGGTAVTGSGTVSSATEDVNGIVLKGVNDGTITFSVTLTDAAGHAGAAATATAGLDTALPPAFTVTPDQSTYDSANDTDFGFTMSPVELGDTYSYAFILARGGHECSRQRHGNSDQHASDRHRHVLAGQRDVHVPRQPYRCRGQRHGGERNGHAPESDPQFHDHAHLCR